MIKASFKFETQKIKADVVCNQCQTKNKINVVIDILKGTISPHRIKCKNCSEQIEIEYK